MRIALVTTWMQPCGIATYSENLAAAFVADGHQVHAFAERTEAERDDTQGDVSGVGVSRCWDRRDPSVSQLVAALQAWRPDVIHVQHEFGLWPERSAMLRLLPMARRVAPVVVTPHTIVDRQYRDLAWFWRVMERNSTPLLIHTDGGHRVAREGWAYPRQLITRIDHGCLDPAVLDWPDRAASRARLGLPSDRAVLLSLGFIGEGKGQDRVVQALYDLIRDGAIRRHEVQYVIAGKPGGGWAAAHEYTAKVQRYISGFALQDVVDLRLGFVPADDLGAWFRAADLAINCSAPTQYSASGRLRLAAIYGCAIIAETVNLHRDMIEAGAACGFSAGSFGALKQALLAMIRDEPMRQRYAQAAAEYAIRTAWPIVARQHVQWYEEVIRGSVR
jgi:glycosyltransferase involved in cell wall biosynthesis